MTTRAAGHAAVGETPRHRGLITGSIMLATIMQALDTTIANVALPHMQGSLSATQDQISWVLTSYIVAAAIMTPPTGFLAARLGRKRLFLAAVAGFTLASMLCGAAQTLSQMVLFQHAIRDFEVQPARVDLGLFDQTGNHRLQASCREMAW